MFIIVRSRSQVIPVSSIAFTSMICRFNKITHAHFNAFKSGIRHEATAATAAVDHHNIPSPKGLPLVGTTFSLICAGGAPRLHLYADRRHKQLGPIFKEQIGPVSAIFLSAPELMRTVFAQEGKCPMHILPEAWSLYNEIYGCSRGLFFMNGDEWLRNRRIMNKILLKGDTGWIEAACEVVSADLVNQWEILRKRREILPGLEGLLYRWSLNTIIAVLLGKRDYRKREAILNPLLDRLSSVVHLIFEASVKFQVFPAKIAAKCHLPSWTRFVTTVNTALELANDLIETLMRENGSEDGLLKKMQEENLSMTDIKRIVVDLVLAAGDTTAYTMAWVLYLLAKHPQIQEGIRQSDYSQSYIKNVVRETLRLYPVAPFLTRILPQNTLVGGYDIPAGTLMLFSIYTTGRDSTYFKDAEKFWPDRWLRENSTTNMQQACIPFGFGARSCIGKKIADYQLQTTIAKIIKNYNLDVENDEVEMILKMVAVPSQPIRLKLTKQC